MWLNTDASSAYSVVMLLSASAEVHKHRSESLKLHGSAFMSTYVILACVPSQSRVSHGFAMAIAHFCFPLSLVSAIIKAASKVVAKKNLTWILHPDTYCGLSNGQGRVVTVGWYISHHCVNNIWTVFDVSLCRKRQHHPESDQLFCGRSLLVGMSAGHHSRLSVRHQPRVGRSAGRGVFLTAAQSS